MAQQSGRLLVGCIADDFTGAGDAASFLAAGGLSTLLLTEVGGGMLPAPADAVVVALKSRSVPAAEAVEQSLKAVRWLKKLGAEQIYFKYCSTFDSTPAGNIGPVCDALLREYGLPFTLLCPALLSNGRHVQQGKLLVNGVPLAESPMKNHPLNPMWASSVAQLMRPQSAYPCFEVSADELATPEPLAARVEELERENEHFYLIPDDYATGHGEAIVRAFGQLPFLTGGSGLLEPLARAKSGRAGQAKAPKAAPPRLGRLMVAGSCSEMSRRQIAAWKESGGRALAVEPEMVFEAAAENRHTLAQAYLAHPEQDILYYCSPRKTERSGLSAALEQFNAALVEEILHSAPVERLIVAGGETSGAVTQRLGYTAFGIGPSVAPGVPVLYPVGGSGLRIVLKSGNFGKSDFFLTTLKE